MLWLGCPERRRALEGVGPNFSQLHGMFVGENRDSKPAPELDPWSGGYAGIHIAIATESYAARNDVLLKEAVDKAVQRLLSHRTPHGYIGPWPTKFEVSVFGLWCRSAEGGREGVWVVEIRRGGAGPCGWKEQWRHSIMSGTVQWTACAGGKQIACTDACAYVGAYVGACVGTIPSGALVHICVPWSGGVLCNEPNWAGVSPRLPHHLS